MLQAKTIERRGLAKGLKLWIDLLFYVSLFAGGLLTVTWPIAVLAGYGGIDLSIPVSIGEGSIFPVQPLVVDPPDQAGLPAEATPDHSLYTLVKTRGELRFLEASTPTTLVYWAHQLVFFGALIFGLHLLRGILRTTIEGRPFHRENPRRLNRLGWLIVATGLLVPISQFFFGAWALSWLPDTTIPLSASIQLYEEWVVAGLLVLLLAAIWKEAVRMAEEQSLTV